MTVRQSAPLPYLFGATALMVALALAPGFAGADDCVVAAAPNAAAVAAKPRPPVRPAVKRAPPAIDLNALAEPTPQPVGRAKPNPPARPRVAVHRKRPPATAKRAASQQAAPKPAAKAVPTCAPVTDPQATLKSPLIDAPRFTPTDPTTRLLSESSVPQDPLQGIRTGLPGEGSGPSFPIALLPTPPDGGSQVPVVEKPATFYPISPTPPISLIPPFVTTPPVELIPPVVTTPPVELIPPVVTTPPVELIPPVVTTPPVELIPPITDRPIDPEGPQPVPAPASVWLVLAGLGALLRQRYRPQH